MEGTLKINLKDVVSQTKKSAANKTEIPDDFLEIIPKYVAIYHGCWIKYTNKDTGLSYPGGYLIEVEDDIVTLRNIRRDVFELPVYEHIFYCKIDSPQHKAVKAIIEEKDKFSIKVEAFNVERQKFLERRKAAFNG